MKKMTKCIKNNAENTRAGGYVALSLVSTITLIMLIVSVSIAGRMVGIGGDVGDYQSFHAARVVALSCVSIAREKVMEEGSELLGSGEAGETVWLIDSLDGGGCRVTSTETVFGANFNIVAYAGGQKRASVALAMHIEKVTGRIIHVAFL